LRADGNASRLCGRAVGRFGCAGNRRRHQGADDPVQRPENWQKSWFASNGYHLSGYWDANLAQWRGNAHQNVSGRHQNITVVGVTPVFRYERADKRGWFAEAGIGVSLFSELYNNDDNRLSTAFQFADHSAPATCSQQVGTRRQDPALPNGGIKQPNSGVNLFLVKATYRFERCPVDIGRRRFV
jgi:hypothetical protein